MMKFPIQRLHIILTTASLLWGLSSPAFAQQIWSGTGKIVSGAGEGGTVELSLSIIDYNLQFLSGPSKNEPPFQLNKSTDLNGTVTMNAGTWEFVQTGNELGVSLSQNNPYRIIRYRLFPKL
ncbi:hypothetical protein NIES37_47260 [Tolypothrix tenuis PCC 7101]|uniref:Uncharacterized protein n=1 Tax=Tolypothrix tenuis PCC 7101 TaxID=231146 RepID=A0A1Z4N4R0_9CYAN|nr:hypothetical protein [Aulosira sp. FACHB-113]BAZ00730.1 hypothetical protein NIES37_47260 [Tolypothrix tenuis PCC 7101]BAZ75347.1 hypothetical protein NIES50_39290 [Aulosira laxa NIES-50]